MIEVAGKPVNQSMPISVGGPNTRYTDKFDSSKGGYNGYTNLSGVKSPNVSKGKTRFASNGNGGDSSIISDGVINLTGYLNAQN